MRPATLLRQCRITYDRARPVLYDAEICGFSSTNSKFSPLLFAGSALRRRNGVKVDPASVAANRGAAEERVLCRGVDVLKWEVVT
ncbi:hypothetical protein Trydic_g12464 [Trypoxylus dichotomus]